MSVHTSRYVDTLAGCTRKVFGDMRDDGDFVVPFFFFNELLQLHRRFICTYLIVELWG